MIIWYDSPVRNDMLFPDKKKKNLQGPEIGCEEVAVTTIN